MHAEVEMREKRRKRASMGGVLRQCNETDRLHRETEYDSPFSLDERCYAKRSHKKHQGDEIELGIILYSVHVREENPTHTVGYCNVSVKGQRTGSCSYFYMLYNFVSNAAAVSTSVRRYISFPKFFFLFLSFSLLAFFLTRVERRNEQRETERKKNGR